MSNINEETVDEVVEVPEEPTIEPETEEVVEEVPEEEVVETPEIEINYGGYSNLGTEEEIKTYLADVIGDNPTAETKEAINKLLAKFNEENEEEEAEVKPDEDLVETTRSEVLNNLPIKTKEFNELTKWVSNQPKEYQEELEKQTNYSTNSPEDIKKAILKAHKDRIKSVGGTANIDTASSGYNPLSKQDVMSEYKKIHLTSKGQERINKINELKKTALNDSKLKQWAEIYFN